MYPEKKLAVFTHFPLKLVVNLIFDPVFAIRSVVASVFLEDHTGNFRNGVNKVDQIADCASKGFCRGVLIPQILLVNTADSCFEMKEKLDYLFLVFVLKHT